MSEVWRLQTKTDLSQVNTNGISVAEYCINENVMAMGWTLRESLYDFLEANDKNSLKNEEKEISTPYLDPLMRFLACGAAASEARISRRVDPSR